MTDLEKLRAWIATYPAFDILAHFQCDFTDNAVPNNAGLFPSGLEEVERRTYITGGIAVTNQYNFGLYCVFPKDPKDDIGAAVNAGWVMDFQLWVQEQSVRRLAPVFGDEPMRETIKAQNGTLYNVDEDGTVGVYMVQLAVQFIKKFKEENPWLT